MSTYPQQPRVVPTSGLAVTGFILSLVWAFGAASIAAIILGLVAMQDTRTGRAGGHGLAVAAVVIGIAGLLPMLAFLGLAGLAAIGSTSP